MKKQTVIATHLLVAYDLVRKILKKIDPNHKYAVEKQRVLRDAVVLAILIKCKAVSSAYKCYEKSWEHQIAKDLCCSIKTAKRIYENALKTKFVICKDDMLVATSLIEGYIHTIKPKHTKIEKSYQVFAVRIKKFKCGDKTNISYKKIIESLREQLFECEIRRAKEKSYIDFRKDSKNKLSVSISLGDTKKNPYVRDILAVDEIGIVSFSFNTIGAFLGLSASGARNFICKVEKRGFIKRQVPGLEFAGVLSEFFEKGITLQQIKERYTVVEDRVYKNPACRYLILETRSSATSTGSFILNHLKRRIPKLSKKERKAKDEQMQREAEARETELKQRACSPKTKDSFYAENDLMTNPWMC